MKSKDVIEKEIKVLQLRICRLYENLNIYADFRDIRKVKRLADDIEMCEESVRCLQWVMGGGEIKPIKIIELGD